MTTTTAAAGHKPIPPRAVVAVVIGNWFEFYDFIVFTFFAVMISQAFFPADADPFDNLLATLITFGLGFFTRPLGAAVIGAYADRVGRRAALTLTLMLMAVGSGLIAILPTFEQAGYLAPLGLLIARLIQGFSCGGEVGPATSYLMEAAAPNRRAALTAWQGHSQQLATISGAGIGVILAFALSKEDLYEWGWRIPFLVGVVIAPVGLYIRRQLPETMTIEEAHESGLAVLRNLLRYHAVPVVLGTLIICGGTVSTYVFNYMTTYALQTLKIPNQQAFGITVTGEQVATSLAFTGAIISMLGIWIGAFLADRLPRKPVLVVSRLIFIASIWPAWLILTQPGSGALTLVGLNMALNFLFAIGVGGTYAYLTEAFPKAVRSSGLSILYALSVTIFGGTTQAVVAWLVKTLEDPLVPAWYQIAANVLSVVAVLLLRPHPDSIAERHDKAA